MGVDLMLIDVREADDASRHGGKALGLYRAHALGHRVPPAVVVPVAVVDQLINDPAVAALADEVLAWAARCGVHHLAIRSSIAVEDGFRHSYAGIFRSVFAAVRQPAVSAAIREVTASARSAERDAYELARGVARQPGGMAIVVQAVVPARTSGIAFASHSGEVLRVRVQSTFGLSVDLVQGISRGDVSEYRSDTARLRTEIGAKPLAIYPYDEAASPVTGDFSLGDFGEQALPAKVVLVDEDSGLVYVRVPEQVANTASLRPDLVDRIVAMAAAYPAEFSYGADIEWVEDIWGNVWTVQLRPVTAPLPELDRKTDGSRAVEAGDVTIGEPGSPGIWTGQATNPATMTEYTLDDGRVLVCGAARPELMPAIARARALISSDGGILCHVAIVARELGKPCVIGILDAERIFRHDETVQVDGTAGLVRRVDSVAAPGGDDTGPSEVEFLVGIEPADVELLEPADHVVVIVASVVERQLAGGSDLLGPLTTRPGLMLLFPADRWAARWQGSPHHAAWLAAGLTWESAMGGWVALTRRPEDLSAVEKVLSAIEQYGSRP